MARGKLIVIDGLDGCGKTTQVEMLKKTFNAVSFHYSDIKNESLYMINRYLNGSYGDLDDIHPEIVVSLFAQNRLTMRQSIIDALEEGKNVILDRYVESNMAFQSAKMPVEYEDSFISWIHNLEYEENDMPMPIVSYFLDVPQEIVNRENQERESSRNNNGSTDIHEADKEYMLNVKKVYETLIAKGRMKQINCVDSTGERISRERLHDILVHDINAMAEEKKRFSTSETF